MGLDYSNQLNNLKLEKSMPCKKSLASILERLRKNNISNSEAEELQKELKILEDNDKTHHNDSETLTAIYIMQAHISDKYGVSEHQNKHRKTTKPKRVEESQYLPYELDIRDIILVKTLSDPIDKKNEYTIPIKMKARTRRDIQGRIFIEHNPRIKARLSYTENCLEIGVLLEISRITNPEKWCYTGVVVTSAEKVNQMIENTKVLQQYNDELRKVNQAYKLLEPNIFDDKYTEIISQGKIKVISCDFLPETNSLTKMPECLEDFIKAKCEFKKLSKQVHSEYGIQSFLW